MNFFELYDLPIKFSIDSSLLRQKYFERSKEFHPDFHINETDAIKDNALSQSTINNNAYKILSNDSLRLRYILELKGILSEQEKEILPQDFLMDMMELNEAITESDPGLMPGLKSRIVAIEETLKNELSGLCKAYDNSSDEALLQSIKTLYLKQKYLLRIKESMLKFASH